MIDGRPMRDIAKIFWIGNSQAIRLPRDLRFPEGVTSVRVYKEGDRLVLEPPVRRRFTRSFWKALGSLPEFERPAPLPRRQCKLFP